MAGGRRVAVRVDAPACAFPPHALQSYPHRPPACVLISISGACPLVSALSSQASISFLHPSSLCLSSALAPYPAHSRRAGHQNSPPLAHLLLNRPSDPPPLPCLPPLSGSMLQLARLIPHALQNGSSRTSSSVLISISSAFPHIPALPSHACISIIDLSFLSPSTAQSTCRFQAPIQHDGGSACAHPPPGPGVPTAPGPMGSDARRTPANTAWRWQRRRRCGLAVPHYPSVRRGALDPTASRNRFHGAGHVVGGVHRAELSHARSSTRGHGCESMARCPGGKTGRMQNYPSRPSPSVLMSITRAFPLIPALPSHACLSILNLSSLSPSSCALPRPFPTSPKSAQSSACAAPAQQALRGPRQSLHGPEAAT